MKPLNRKGVLTAQRYALAAKQACMIISLGILYDQFECNDGQMQNAINLYKYETSKYNCWTPQAVDQAEKDFRKVAKTFKGANLNRDISKVGYRTDVSRMIWNTEATCFFTMLRILRTYFKANYEQLEYFVDMYDEFNKRYQEGEQATMRQLSHELYEITGFDILKIEKGLLV